MQIIHLQGKRQSKMKKRSHPKFKNCKMNFWTKRTKHLLYRQFYRCIQGPDFWTNKEKYLEHEWNRKPKKWIDPQKEANANKIAITTGQKTLNDIWREDGKDFKTVLDDMKKLRNMQIKSDLI